MLGYLIMVADVAQAPDPTTDPLVYLLGIALTGAVSTSGFQLYKHRKQAGREDDSLIAAATGKLFRPQRRCLPSTRRAKPSEGTIGVHRGAAEGG